MGRNYYLNSKFVVNDKYEYVSYRECHIGRNNWLDLIDICKFFLKLLDIFEEETEQYRKYLSKLNNAVVSMRENPSSKKVYNSRFDNLPDILIEIYHYIINKGYKLSSYDEYDDEYNFEIHIRSCIDTTQKEFGGLRYSTNTDFF
jgi:hypothetical protein